MYPNKALHINGGGYVDISSGDYSSINNQVTTMTLKDQTNNNNDGTLKKTATWSTPRVTSGVTLDQPTLTTISASQISGRTNATLTGSINPNNYTLTDIMFEYGTTSGQYDHNTVAVPANPWLSSDAIIPKPKLITGGSSIGNNGTTTKLRGTPQVTSSNIVVTTGEVISINTTGVKISGLVNPNGNVLTAVHFEYYTALSATLMTQAVPLSVTSGTNDIPVIATLSGLDPFTLYYYRLKAIATNGFETTGFDQSFNMSSNAGLWIGQIELTQVNEVGYKSTDTQTPTDVSSPFQMKIILHENTAGDVNLLRKVTLMQKVNTLTNQVTRHLITDDNLLPAYEGVVRRDGKLVGIRMSSLFFDFDSALNELPLMGSIAPGNTVSGFVYLAKDHPNNPFRHLYHPDHKQGIDIIREIKMTFDPLDTNNPQSGVYNLKGKYEETLKGVHKIPIKMRGTFVLNRVSVIAKLNANQ